MTATSSFTACHYGADDELVHEAPDEHGYNESVYINWACGDDQEQMLGGLVRIALRPADGYAELTLIGNMRDGYTIFKYARVDLSLDDVTAGGDTYASAGCEIAVREPTRRWALTFAGEAHRLPDLGRFGDAPGAEWRAAEVLDVELRLAFTATHPMHTLSEHGGLHAKIADDPAARDHYEQWGTLAGDIVIGGSTFALRPCVSLRDHSWGKRDWDTIPDANQIMGFWDDGTRAVSLSTEGDGDEYDAHGSAWLPGLDAPVDITAFPAIPEYLGESIMVDEFPVRLTIDGRSVHITAHVLAMFPTRVGRTHRDALALVRLSGDLGPGGGWIDLFRERIDGASGAA